jgi:DNA-binding beta-propeller fold protein YncE
MTFIKKTALAGSLLLTATFASLTAQTAAPAYKILNRISLVGEGGWDYLTMDEPTSRLFVSHAGTVQVVDTKTSKLVGTIEKTNGVHGIALAPDLNKGFVSCGRDSSVVVFDYKTLAVLSIIKGTGTNPDAILYEPKTQRVLTFNGGSANATVIDAKTELVLGTIPFDGKPEFSTADGKGRVFVNIETKSTINVINAATMKVDTIWSLAPGEEPTGMAIDRKNNRLFSVCGNKKMIITDATTGKTLATPTIGERCDGVVFDPTTKRAFSSNGDGTMTVVEETAKGYVVVENMATQKGARTAAIDTQTHHVFMPTAEYEPTPAPTQANPKPRAKQKPNSFVVLEIVPNK